MNIKEAITVAFVLLSIAIIEFVFFSNVIFIHSTGMSMYPTIGNNTNNICIRQSDYKVGDIVVYRSNQSVFPDYNISHRIVWKLTNGWLEIQGDNEDEQMNEYIPEKDVLCRIVYWINK